MMVDIDFSEILLHLNKKKDSECLSGPCFFIFGGKRERKKGIEFSFGEKKEHLATHTYEASCHRFYCRIEIHIHSSDYHQT